jgi:hypothetical protein
MCVSLPARPRPRQSFVLLAVIILAAPAAAADRFVVVSGDWSSTSTWSGGVVPTVNDNAWVGSNSLATATVTLSQNVTAGNVTLGRDGGSSGTLDIGNFTFTAGNFSFGQNGAATILRGTGHLDVSGFTVANGNTYTLPSVDIVQNDVAVFSGGTLRLSANLSIADQMNLAGSGSTLDAQGFNISVANELLLGWNGVGAQLINRGTITTGRMNVRGQNFDLTSSDNVGHFVMRAGSTNLGAGVAVGRLDLTETATGTTTQTGNVANTVLVEGGSTLTLGANLSLSDSLNIRGTGSTLNANGHNIAASNQFLLGWDAVGAQLINRGTITAGRMNVRGQNFDLTPTDAVGYFIMRAGTTNLGNGVVVGRLDLMENATGTTTQSGNITNIVLVESGSSLALGANLTLSDSLNIRGTGTALNASGHDIAATNQILIGWDGGNPALQNRGTLSTNNLSVRNQGFQLNSTDSILNFNLSNGATNLGSGVAIERLTLTSNATAVTNTAANISRSVELQSGSSLSLNANLALTENVNILGAGTTLSANTHDITTPGQFLHGWNGSGKPVVQSVGKLDVGELYLGNGAELALGSGLDSSGRIHLRGNSRVTLMPSVAGTGLTLTRWQTTELDIASGSHLTLSGNGNNDGWAFRWANPVGGGDHVADIDNLISQGRIDFTFGSGYTVTSNADGYTYILVPVPEPASVLGLCAVVVGLGTGLRNRRRRSRSNGSRQPVEIAEPPIGVECRRRQ